MRTGSANPGPKILTVVAAMLEGAQQQMWPDWRHHAFNAGTEHDTAEATGSTAPTTSSSPAIGDLK